MIKTLEDRFWSKVWKSEECWVWLGTTTSTGYGIINIAQKLTRVHRLSYEWAYGIIPSGMDVLHKCDDPLCVRPSHLFTGTQTDNNADRDLKERQARGAKHSEVMRNWHRQRKNVPSS